MSGHFIKRCTFCGIVISQCRCPGPRQLQRGVCADCYERRRDPKVAENMRPLSDPDIVNAPSQKVEGV